MRIFQGNGKNRILPYNTTFPKILYSLAHFLPLILPTRCTFCDMGHGFLAYKDILAENRFLPWVRCFLPFQFSFALSRTHYTLHTLHTFCDHFGDMDFSHKRVLSVKIDSFLEQLSSVPSCGDEHVSCGWYVALAFPKRAIFFFMLKYVINLILRERKKKMHHYIKSAWSSREWCRTTSYNPGKEKR